MRAPKLAYFDYPAGSDTVTTCATAGAGANTANCAFAVFDLTDVGSYTGAASPNGTFDQGGNVFEWNETMTTGSSRVVRGGSFNNTVGSLAASSRSSSANEVSFIGFRVASPVPAALVPSLSPLGMAMLWSLLGIAGWRKLRR